MLVYHRQPGCGRGRPWASLGSREHRPAPRPDRPPLHPGRPRRRVRRVLRCRGRGLRAPRPRARGHRGRLGAAELRPRDRQHRGVRRRTAGRCRRGDHGWACAPRVPCCRASEGAASGRGSRRGPSSGRPRSGRRGSARWHRTGRSPSACCGVAATRWGTRRGCSSCPRVARSRSGPLPAGYTLATADTAEREHAAYVVIQDAFDEWEGRVRELRSRTGRRHRASPRCATVAAAGRRARRGWSWGHRSRSSTARGSGTWTSSPSSGRTVGRDWPRRCSPTRSAGARERGATRSELSTDSRTRGARPLPQGRHGGHPGLDAPGDRPAAVRRVVAVRRPGVRTRATYWSRASSALVPCTSAQASCLARPTGLVNPGRLPCTSPSVACL